MKKHTKKRKCKKKSYDKYVNTVKTKKRVGDANVVVKKQIKRKLMIMKNMKLTKID